MPNATPNPNRDVTQPAPPANPIRYVLGEGFGIGKGVFGGGFRWVGLSGEAGGAEPICLRHFDTDQLLDGRVQYPDKRRRFRLVLEVPEGPEIPEIEIVPPCVTIAVGGPDPVLMSFLGRVGELADRLGVRLNTVGWGRGRASNANTMLGGGVGGGGSA